MSMTRLNEASISSEVRLANGDRIVTVNRLDAPGSYTADEMHLNLFRLSSDGKVIWKVCDYKPLGNSTFTKVYEEKGKIFSSNFDGIKYEVTDLDSGVVTASLLVR
jgi:hypothetical protein